MECADDREPVEDGSPCQRTAPAEIYLLVSDDRDHYNEEFPRGVSGDEVTWCTDRALDCAIRYVRADLVTATTRTPTGAAPSAPPSRSE